MTRDDIIRMAREAYGDWYPNAVPPALERFAALVAAYEREECAQLVEEMVKHEDGLDDFANSVRKGGRRLCSDGRPKWLKIAMQVAAERKSCADLCDAHGNNHLGDLIRARNETYDLIPARSKS